MLTPAFPIQWPIIDGFNTSGSPWASDSRRLPAFNWSSLTPSTDILWHSCHEYYQCARFAVPMDWQDDTVDETVAIAIIKLPASVPESDPQHGGGIFINPGGPGGSGVDFLLQAGKLMQDEITGSKQFDIISWDPRGVHLTTPSSACLDTDLDQQAFELKYNAVGNIDQSSYAFHAKWAAVESFSSSCNSTIHRHMTTLDVTYDMVAMLDKMYPSETALLQYWGFSYGSLLGNTFASRFPHRVGRMIMDGVVDAIDYSATGWSSNLRDTDRVLAYFYDYCARAGESCPLYEPTPSKIQAKVEKLLAQLRERPMPVSYAGRADIVQFYDVRRKIFVSLYFPNERFEPLAQLLKDLMDGNTTSMATELPRIGDPPPWRPSPPTDDVWGDNPAPADPHTFASSCSIYCTDGSDISNRTIEEHEAYLNRCLEHSSLVGGIWAEITLCCTKWPKEARAPEHSRFVGPYGSKLSDYDTRASPLLWIGNEADPVTPIHNAWKMAKLHQGSIVLGVDQSGHCSGPLQPNKCVWATARQFFNEGVLPENGTVCPGDKLPWGIK